MASTTPPGGQEPVTTTGADSGGTGKGYGGQDYRTSATVDAANVEGAGAPAPALQQRFLGHPVSSTTAVKVVGGVGVFIAVLYGILCIIYASGWYVKVIEIAPGVLVPSDADDATLGVLHNRESKPHLPSIYLCGFMFWICISSLVSDIFLCCKYFRLSPTMNQQFIPTCPATWSIVASIIYAFFGFLQVIAVTALVAEMFKYSDKELAAIADPDVFLSLLHKSRHWYTNPAWENESFVGVAITVMVLGYLFLIIRILAIVILCKFKKEVRKQHMQNLMNLPPPGSPGTAGAMGSGGGTVIMSSQPAAPGYAPYGGTGTPVYNNPPKY